MFGRRSLLLLPCLALGLVSSGTALGQTTSSSSSGGTTSNSGTENINSPLPNPARYLLQNGQYVNMTDNPRPQNLNPTGVNWLDCEGDLRLDFSLVISGFASTDAAHIETWAGYVDCTQQVNRTGTTGTSQPCWKVAGDTNTIFATSTDALPAISVYARDVLRYSQPQSVAHTTYDGTWHSTAAAEQTACYIQTSDAALHPTIYFVAVNSSGQPYGTAYAWSPTGSNGGWDLVAPPPPTIDSVDPGDTLLQVQWTSPGNDPDLVGYAVWSDPPAGGSTTGGCSCGQTAGGGANSYAGGDATATVGDEVIYQCMEASAESGDDGATEGGDDGSSAADGALADALDETLAEGGAVEASLPEASMPEASTSEAGPGDGGAPEAGTGDAGATTDAGTDAGPVNCGGINVGGGGTCYSANLTGHVYAVGTTSTTTTTTDASTADVTTPAVDASSSSSSGSSSGGSSEGGVTLSGGGIASINGIYKAGEIDDFTATQLTLTGLTNGLTYKVVVTSIDGSGNVGTPSTPTSCAKPSPTNDYWKTYKQDGGAASGCALGGGPGAPVFAVGVGIVAAMLRRRRRR